MPADLSISSMAASRPSSDRSNLSLMWSTISVSSDSDSSVSSFGTSCMPPIPFGAPIAIFRNFGASPIVIFPSSFVDDTMASAMSNKKSTASMVSFVPMVYIDFKSYGIVIN